MPLFMSILILCSLTTVSDSHAMSLGQLAARKILEDDQAEKSYKRAVRDEEVPSDVDTFLGGEYCKENLPRAWQCLPEKTVLRRPQQGESVRGVSFVGDTQIAVSGHSSGILLWWDTQSGRCVARCSTGQGGMRCMAVSSSGKLIATAYEHTIKLWNTITEECIASLRTKEDPTSLYFSVDASCLVVGGDLGTVSLWQLSGDKGVEKIDEYLHVRLSPESKILNRVSAVRMSADGTMLFSVVGKSLKCLNRQSRAAKELSVDHTALLARPVFTNDRGVLWCFTDGTLFMTDITSGRTNKILRADSGFESVVCSDDGRFLVTGHQDGVARLWQRNGQEYSPLNTFQADKAYITRLSFRGDGCAFLAGECFGALSLWTMPRMGVMTLNEAQSALKKMKKGD